VRHSGRTDNKGRPIKDRYSENNDRRNVGRLIFEVLPSGKSFYFQYFPKDGSRRLVRIGPFKADNTTPGYTLAEAREKRDKYSRLLQDGIDIKTHIEQQREAEQQRVRDHEDSKRNGTFGQLLDSYVLWMKAGGKRSYQSVNDSLTTYVRKPFPGLLSMRGNQITSDHILDIIGRMINSGIRQHSNRVRSYLMAAFNHGLKQDHDPVTYLTEKPRFNLTVNPVASLPRQDKFEQVREHELTPDEIRIVWDVLPKEHLLAGYLMRLTLSTTQRHGELLRLEWGHVDFNKRELHMPPEITKNKRHHVVPINNLSYGTLKELHKITGEYQHLFPAKRRHIVINGRHALTTSVNQQVRGFIKEHDIRPFQCKDTRGTVKTLMGEAGISKEIRDRIQNHAINDVSAKHYDRYDYMKEKQQGLNAWNRKLETIISGKRAKVVRLTG